MRVGQCVGREHTHTKRLDCAGPPLCGFGSMHVLSPMHQHPNLTHCNVAGVPLGSSTVSHVRRCCLRTGMDMQDHVRMCMGNRKWQHSTNLAASCVIDWSKLQVRDRCTFLSCFYLCKGVSCAADAADTADTPDACRCNVAGVAAARSTWPDTNGCCCCGKGVNMEGAGVSPAALGRKLLLLSVCLLLAKPAGCCCMKLTERGNADLGTLLAPSWKYCWLRETSRANPAD